MTPFTIIIPLCMGLGLLSLVAARYNARLLLRLVTGLAMIGFLVFWYVSLFNKANAPTGAGALMMGLMPLLITAINVARWPQIEDRMVRQAQGPWFFFMAFCYLAVTILTFAIPVR